MDELSKIVQSYQDLSHKQTLEFKEAIEASLQASFLAESLRNTAAEAKDSYLKLYLEASQGRVKASMEELAQNTSSRCYEDEKEVRMMMDVDCATLRQLAKRVEKENAALVKEAEEANDRVVSHARRILGASVKLESGNSLIIQNEKREVAAKESSRKFLLDATSVSEASASLRAESNDMTRRAGEIEVKSHIAENALAGLKADCAIAEKTEAATKAAEAVAIAAVGSYTAAIASSTQQIQALELKRHLREVDKRRR
jgi:hypothetical protein